MAKTFTQWTVLPHKPLEKLADNLWSVEGTMPSGDVRRVMVLARLGDGRVVVHNAIALEETHMKELEAWGTPSFIVVPNGYHRQDARIWKDRYPAAKVLCPEGAKKKVAKVVAPDGSYDDLPADPDVTLAHLDGCKKGEGALVVRSGDRATVVVNDVLMNIPKAGGMMGFALAPTGRFSVPRLFRWFFTKDKTALAASLEKLAGTPGLERVIVSHGDAVTDEPGEGLRAAARELTGV